MQGAVLLGLLEQVTHARGAHAHEHLDEVGAGDREERHARLARDGAREQRLARARRPVEQHSLGDARSERLEFLRVFEELLDLVEFLNGFVDPRDVTERDLRRVHRHSLGARFAEAHDLRAAALHLIDDEQPEQQEDHERQDVGEHREPAGSALPLDVDRDLVDPKVVDQLLLGVVRVGGGVLLVVRRGRRVRGDVDRVVLRVDRHRPNLVPVDLREEAGVDGRLAVVARADQLLGKEGQHHHDEDRECRAFEETTQGSWCLFDPEGSNVKPGQPSVAGVVRHFCGFKAPFDRLQRPIRPYGLDTSSDQPTRPRTAGCGSAPRSRARSRSRTGSGSQSRCSGSGRSTLRRSGFVSRAHTSSDVGLRAFSVRIR